MTPTEAMAHAPASADKTALIAAVTTLLAAIDTAEGNTRISEASAIQLKSEYIDVTETLASNLTA